MNQRTPTGGPPRRIEGSRPPDGRYPPVRDPRRAPKRRGSSPLLAGLLYAGLGLLVLVVAAVTFLVISPPTDLMRREIVAQVKAATGRDLQIAGPMSITFYPSAGVSAGDVTLSAPPGMGGDPLLTAESIDVGVALLPLIRQEVVVDRLVLHRPVFALRVDREGRRSWDTAQIEAPHRVRLAQADTGEGGTRLDFSPGTALAGGSESGGERPRQSGGVSLADVRVLDGTVRYSDERTGLGYEIAAIGAEMRIPSIAAPLDAKGSFVWSSEKIDFDVKLTALQDVIEERPAKLALQLTGRPLKLSFDGAVTLNGAPSAEGQIAGDAASLRGLVGWLGTELAPGPGLGAVTAAGNVRVAENAVRLADAKLTLDGATATGTIDVTTGGARPHVRADLAVSGLNIGNFGAGSGARPPSTPDQPSAPATETPAPAAPDSIEDLLDTPQPAPGPQVKGYTKRAGWSTEPFDLRPLGRFDADAKLALNSCSYRNIQLDGSQVSLALKDNVLKATFDDVQLYKGRGKGDVTLDGIGPDPAIGLNLTLSGIAVGPLLKDTADIDWLAGHANIKLALTGHGSSEAAIVQALKGTANVAVKDGALIGYDLGAAMQALADGKVPDFDGSQSDKTEFKELTGTFLIADGIAKNDDLKLTGELLRATGAGTVQLPARSLDYIVRPKILAASDAEAAKENAAGIEVPVHVTGAWSEPEFAPDVGGAINNPGTVEAVKELGKKFKGKKAGEVLEDLFGKKEDGEPSKAERLLQKFLGPKE
jgi:AsmA protein